MKWDADIKRWEFTRFSRDMVQGVFPGIDLVQMDSGPLRGWIFSAKVGPYHVNAGSFDRVLLYDGRYNPEMVHIGLISSQEHSAMSQAHEYDSGAISLDYGSSYMHEVYPAKMVWANISASEAVMMKGIQFPRRKLYDNPHLLIGGPRAEVMPLIGLVNEIMLKRSKEQSGSNSGLEGRLETLLHALLSARLSENTIGRPYVAGDRYRMFLLEKIEELCLKNSNMPLSLDDICTAIRMKRRTVQKYFHDIYGMGPTEYLRIRRLNSARVDLMKGATSVSSVADRRGFVHFGRFSKNYKALFNESPSSTMNEANTSF